MPGEYTIKISPDGQQVTVDAEGFRGTSCEDQIKSTIEALGEIKESRKKPEYYETAEEHIKVGA